LLRDGCGCTAKTIDKLRVPKGVKFVSWLVIETIDDDLDGVAAFVVVVG
jgi:hypothetical protein